MRAASFFAYARERHEIYLRRADGLPRGKWTKDPILQTHRFTNVFRELDKTTDWFARNVRGPMRDKPEVMLATVLFRLLNRIEVGEAVFLQGDLMDSGSAFWQWIADDYKPRALRGAIHSYVGKRGPFTTGAYIISSPPGYSKLDGVLKIAGDFARGSGWRTVAGGMLLNDKPRPRCRDCADARVPGVCDNGQGLCEYGLEATWRWLRDQPYLGPFHSYEIVTDLRHTRLLERAPDVMTWANVGPGAARGLARVHGRKISERGKLRERVPTDQMLSEMSHLLRMSRDAKYWPQPGKVTRELALNASRWPRWEMRDVEHTLCEFDKYERVRLGHGRPRGVYR